MKILADFNGKTRTLEVDPTSLIEDVKALIEVELSIPYTEQLLSFNSSPLVDDKPLSFYKIKENDTIKVSRYPVLHLFINNSLPGCPSTPLSP